MDIEKLRHKRGRKSKKEIEFIKKYEEQHNVSLNGKEKRKPKKRGRKPKGGKVIHPETQHNTSNDCGLSKMSNVILHLKCGVNDLDTSKSFLSEMKYNPNIENIQPYNSVMNETIENNGLQFYDIEVNQEKKDYNTDKYSIINKKNKYTQEKNKYNEKDTYCCNEKNVNKKLIWEKLKTIQQNLRSNTTANKNSCCFRCTCEFDNPSVSIPMHNLDGVYKCYGNFCNPECAAGFLFDEPIETSIKWERYSLLNNIYKPVYNYDSNIKPAPQPFYLLDKYYGNLTIEEYREMNRNSSYGVIMVVNKPLIRVMPELFTDNSEHNNNKKEKYKLSRNKPPINKGDGNESWKF